MSLLDKLNAGVERAAVELGKAYDKGKGKAPELQIERQWDADRQETL